MKIGNSKKTREIIEKHEYIIKKKFGQNFLVDQNILNKIVDRAEITENKNVIEIGPGLGALTELLCERANKVLAFEIDNTLIPILNDTLKEHSNIKIINKDILEVNITKYIQEYLDDDKEIVLVANLPYYITTAILLKLLQETDKISSYIVMMQQEVANRLTSKPSTKDYNSLSVVIQYKCNTKKILTVPRSVFIPAPNVDSAVVKLDLRQVKDVDVVHLDLFYDIIRKSFSQRRKTLVNNLAQNYHLTKELIITVLENINLDKNIRAENLTIVDFNNLTNELYKNL